MEKKLYMKPQMEVIKIGNGPQLLAGSGVQSEDPNALFNIGFGGLDEEGIVIPE